MNNVRSVEKLAQEEFKLGIFGGISKGSWHEEYVDSAWVFLGGFSFELTEGDLICVMSQWGEIEDIHLVREKETNKSRGFAFIKYEDNRSTILAVDNMNGVKLLNRVLRCDHVEQYRLPKDVREKEAEALQEQEYHEVQIGAGHAYKGKELASEYDINQGVDLWSKPVRADDRDEDDRTRGRQRQSPEDREENDRGHRSRDKDDDDDDVRNDHRERYRDRRDRRDSDRSRSRSRSRSRDSRRGGRDQRRNDRRRPDDSRDRYDERRNQRDSRDRYYSDDSRKRRRKQDDDEDSGTEGRRRKGTIHSRDRADGRRSRDQNDSKQLAEMKSTTDSKKNAPERTFSRPSASALALTGGAPVASWRGRRDPAYSSGSVNLAADRATSDKSNNAAPGKARSEFSGIAGLNRIR